MTSRQPEYLDGKLVNFLRWVDAAANRYQCVPEAQRVQAHDFVQELLTNKSRRENFTSEFFLYGVVNGSDAIARCLALFQNFYYATPETRLAQVEDAISWGRIMAKAFDDVATEWENNKEQVALDLRTVGAYTEIFFAPHLSAWSKKKQQEHANKLE